MTKLTSSIIKGMAIGAAAGALMGTAGSCVVCSCRKNRHSRTQRAADVISDFFENIAYLFK